MNKVEEASKSEKIEFDNLDSFIQHLKMEGKGDIEIEIIKCIATHKSGIDVSHAPNCIESFLGRDDRNIIGQKLPLLNAEKKYIHIDKESYKFNYDQYDIKDIPFVVEKPIEDCGVAVSSDARKSLKETMQNTQSCVYLFMAITPINYFEELLNYRISEGRKTVVFFPHKDCVNINANKGYDDDLNTWLLYQNRHKATDFFKFYLINNKNYKHLYSSCLTENTVRFNYFEYRKDGKFRTGTGRVQAGEKETSFYEMIMKEYEKAFYERIPKLTKYTWKEYVKSFFRKHLIETTIFIIAICAIVFYLFLNLFDSTLATTVSSIFVLITMIIGFWQGRINDSLKREKLKF